MDLRTVFVVEGDVQLRRDLQGMLEAEGYQVEAYACGESVLRGDIPDHAACLLVDADSHGRSSLELQEHLKHQKPPLPVVIMARNPSVPQVVQAVKNGAFDVIVKPVRGDEVLASVEQAIATSASYLDRYRLEARSVARLERLSRRERAVFELVAQGLPNKKIAVLLGIALKTVKVHRSRVMRKLELESLADLVRLATRLDHLAEPVPGNALKPDRPSAVSPDSGGAARRPITAPGAPENWRHRLHP